MEVLEEINVEQFKSFPGTRYMGSKNKIIQEIWKVVSGLQFDSFYDAFGGSNVVGYFMKCQGKRVVTNDFMTLSHTLSKAIIENNKSTLSKKDLEFILKNKNKSSFVQDTYNGIFFDEIDNAFIDKIRYNIDLLEGSYKKNIALASLARACMKKRSRGIFTFVGERYNDGRADMQKLLADHFIENISFFNNAVFDNYQENKAYNKRTEDLSVTADLVYLDPPYYTPNSDNDYTRRYHFVEGLVKNWKGLEIQEHTITKKFESYKTPFSKKETAYEAFEHLLEKFQDSTIVISYSSNSLPTKEELTKMLKKHKRKVVAKEIDHTYSFGNQNHKIGNIANRVKEYLFIGV
jgi:DNA adenine methylase